MNKTYRFLTLLTIMTIMTGTAGLAAAQGYAGVIAEDPDQAAGKTQEALGYNGVISGVAPQSAPAPTVEQQVSPNPATAHVPITNAAQLEEQVRMNNSVREAKDMMKPSKEEWQGLGKQARVEGLLPNAVSTKTVVDSYMEMVSNPKLTPDKKIEYGRLVYKQLVSMNEALQIKKSIPDEMYQQMGLPQSYLNDEKEGNQQSLNIVQKALDSVRQYRQ